MSRKSIFGLVLALIVIALIAAGLLLRQPDRTRETSPAKATSPVSQADGKTVVTLSATSQQQSGIAVVAQHPLTHRPMLQTFGTVVDTADLATLRSNDVAAQAQVEKARAALDASAAEYLRLKGLYQGQRDISEKALQAAEATWRSDQASLHAAETSLKAVQVAADQQWGAVLAKAAAENTPLYQTLSARQQVLVQVMLPAGVSLPQPPPSARLQASDGRFDGATLISPARRADPRLQGASLFYGAPANGLLPGMTVTAYLPTGAPVQGALIPSSAVVWWQGQPWVYARIKPDRFERLALPANNPAEGGWFVPRGFAGDAPIVGTGAQLLLSEEQRSQISGGEDAGDSE